MLVINVLQTIQGGFSVLQQVQGIWAQGIEDASCASVNHKYRLITFGRAKYVGCFASILFNY